MSTVGGPHIQTPRENATPRFGSMSTRGRQQDGIRLPRFFKRLLKFPQMDFEMSMREMLDLMIAPKKVFRNVYYHKQTKNTWHRPDPSFTYLLSFFMALTGIAWGVWAGAGVGGVVQLTVVYVFGHFLAFSLTFATMSYFLVGKFLGPGIAGLPKRRRQTGLFIATNERETLEFGYCFDVSIRAFFPVWVLLYVLQFIILPLIGGTNMVSTLFGNTLYLIAFGYYTVITFLGYNALPFLHHTELLLSPLVAFGIFWFVSLFGFNIPRHFSGIMILGSGIGRNSGPSV